MRTEKVKASIIETHWGVKIKVVTIRRIRRRVTREGIGVRPRKGTHRTKTRR